MLFMIQYSLAKIYIVNGVNLNELMGFNLGETVAASISKVLWDYVGIHRIDIF